MLGYYMLFLPYCNILIYCQHPACTQLFYNRHSSFFTSLTMLRSTSATVSATTGLLLAFSIHINLISAAHAGFHVQYPWATRGPNPKIRPEIDQYNPFCGTLSPNLPLYLSQQHQQQQQQQTEKTTKRQNPRQPHRILPQLPYIPLLQRPPRRSHHRPLHSTESTQATRRFPSHHPAGNSHPAFGTAVRERYATAV